MAWRQLGIVDRWGHTAVRTGAGPVLTPDHTPVGRDQDGSTQPVAARRGSADDLVALPHDAPLFMAGGISQIASNCDKARMLLISCGRVQNRCA